MNNTSPALTVSELTADIKEVLENVFFDVCVIGEVSNARQPSSGHIYFSLKDDKAQIKSVLFKGASFKLKFALTDGMKVICRGRVGIYERDGQYQLYVSSIEPQGQGAQQLAFAQLKERLSKEGLFDTSSKKELPFLPRAIGVVTSLSGAVIRDILHVLDRRFASVHVIIYPAAVQGEGASYEIAEGIKTFNHLKNVDVIILARGGGSLEDLWCFNEENLAYAIYESEIPVVSAIGHETDFTIADFVADKRAPTPSAAAEIVVPSMLELKSRLESLLRFLWKNFSDIVPQHAQHLDDLMDRLTISMDHRIKKEELRLGHLRRQLTSLNPTAVLERGYSITSLAARPQARERILYSSQEAKKGDKIKIRLFKGELQCEVLEILS